ncbi:MAG: hypothetical protein QXF46_09660, partial [Thermofilaceae archaeon]
QHILSKIASPDRETTAVFLPSFTSRGRAAETVSGIQLGAVTILASLYSLLEGSIKVEFSP